MKIYLACSGCMFETYPVLTEKFIDVPRNIYELRSYCEFTKFTGHTLPIYGKDVFIDSGAFSARSMGFQVDIDKYAKFLMKFADQIHIYANLDEIPLQYKGPEVARECAEITLKNQVWLEERGLKPLPVFHRGEPYEYLQYYVDNYEYICMGGLVSRYIKNGEYFDEVWGKYLTDGAGRPRVKAHAFGMTSHTHVKNYPWYSADSSSWLIMSKLGQLYIPPRRADGTYNYDKKPSLVSVSDRSTAKEHLGAHISTMSPSSKLAVAKYLQTLDLEIRDCALDHVARFIANMNYWINLQDYAKFAKVFKKRQTELL